MVAKTQRESGNKYLSCAKHMADLNKMLSNLCRFTVFYNGFLDRIPGFLAVGLKPVLFPRAPNKGILSPLEGATICHLDFELPAQVAEIDIA